MNFKFLPQLLATFIILGLTACESDTKLNKLEDKFNNQAKGLERASEHIEDVEKNVIKAIESYHAALKEVEDPEDKKKIRDRVNEIFDELTLEINKSPEALIKKKTVVK